MTWGELYLELANPAIFKIMSHHGRFFRRLRNGYYANRFYNSKVMSRLSRFYRRLAEDCSDKLLLDEDSPFLRPLFACTRAVSKSMHGKHLAKISDFAGGGRSKILDELPESVGFCYPPTSFEDLSPGQPRVTRFGPIRAILLKDQCVDICSSYPFDEKRKRLYVDPAFNCLPANASNAGGHLLRHGKRYGIVGKSATTSTLPQGIFLGGNGSSNFYHWLLDIVPKLQVLSRLPEALAGHPLLVSRRVAEIGTFAEILNVLAPNRELIYLEEGKSYLVGDATFIEPFVTGPYNILDCKFSAEYYSTRPDAIHYLRDSVLPALEGLNPQPWPERVFLARSNRRSYNQDELATIAVKNGFEVLYMEQHSFLMQAGYFANARVLMGATGAAWANLVFADCRSKALCWMPEELGEFSAFSNIAGIVGMDMRYLFYESGARNPNDIYSHSYKICPALFQRALNRVVD